MEPFSSPHSDSRHARRGEQGLMWDAGGMQDAGRKMLLITRVQPRRAEICRKAQANELSKQDSEGYRRARLRNAALFAAVGLVEESPGGR